MLYVLRCEDVWVRRTGCNIWVPSQKNILQQGFVKAELSCPPSYRCTFIFHLPQLLPVVQVLVLQPDLCAVATLSEAIFSPRNMADEQEPVDVFFPGQGDAAGGGQNGGGLAPPGAAGAATAWSDSRPFSGQIPSYPVTCLLIAVFITVSREQRSGASVRLILLM